MGYMTYTGYYGYSAGNTIVLVLTLLLKIFAFVLFVAVAAGIVMWIRNTYMDSVNRQKSEPETDQIFKDAPVLKIAAVIGAGILGIILICTLFNWSSWYVMGYGFNLAYAITGVLMLIIKTLVVFLIISLVMAAITMVKDQNVAKNKNQV
ncbi:MAG TPA: hypothetical protein VEG39_20280 [Clostridia bacterium]|nr:hypothetical protein [Clostridia bacterium]